MTLCCCLRQWRKACVLTLRLTWFITEFNCVLSVDYMSFSRSSYWNCWCAFFLLLRDFKHCWVMYVNVWMFKIFISTPLYSWSFKLLLTRNMTEHVIVLYIRDEGCLQLINPLQSLNRVFSWSPVKSRVGLTFNPARDYLLYYFTL